MITVIGNPTDRRIALFQAACERLEQPFAHVIDYADLLNHGFEAIARIPAGSVVRIESPGKDAALQQRIAEFGGATTRAEIGQILNGAAWYRGFVRLLEGIRDHLPPGCHLMNQPDDIAVMFDKPRCYQRLFAAGIPVPHCLGSVDSFTTLRHQMDEQRQMRVFIKPAFGSSASGVVAYQRYGRHQRLIGPIEYWNNGDEVRLYNNRRMITYTDGLDIRMIIDTLCQEPTQIETWLPKAMIDEFLFDLRVVVIAGRVRHCVVRMSRSPITNLHLLNPRGELELAQASVGMEAWNAAMQTCERVAGLFSSQYAGIDLMFEPNGNHAVLEVNAFGDLLPNVLHEGHDTYTAQLIAQGIL